GCRAGALKGEQGAGHASECLAPSNWVSWCLPLDEPRLPDILPHLLAPPHLTAGRLIEPSPAARSDHVPARDRPVEGALRSRFSLSSLRTPHPVRGRPRR